MLLISFLYKDLPNILHFSIKGNEYKYTGSTILNSFLSQCQILFFPDFQKLSEGQIIIILGIRYYDSLDKAYWLVLWFKI